MADPESSVTDEQLEYYRARAYEYDQWWLREGRYDRGRDVNRRWLAEADQIATALSTFQPSGSVLELACGTGIWSEKLLPRSSSLTLVDGSDEMLSLARRRLQSSEVRYIKANLFEWRPRDRFDLVFFSFWLSHVPPERFVDFWRLVRDCLAPGGSVFFVDSLHDETSIAIDHQLPDIDAITQRRRLNDGREFEICKVYYRAAELQERLGDLGWDIRVSSTERYFFYGHGHHQGFA